MSGSGAAGKTVITCAVTGGGAIGPRSTHVPRSPKAIADECLAAAKAGAAVVHIHVRDPGTGAPSMERAYYREVVDRIRQANPDLVLNLTTGPGARFIPGDPDPRQPGPGTTLASPEDRVAHVLELRPEICTLDVATMNFGSHAMVNTPAHLARMADLIRGAGVTPELEVFDLGQIELSRRLIAAGHIASPPLYQLCLGIAGGAPATAEVMVQMRRELPPDAVWSGFGIASRSFPMVAQAAVLGGHVRVGLEDNLYLSRGVLAEGNAVLVARAAQIVELLGGAVATPAEARAIFRLRANS